jgi:hypothetical protein
MKSHGVVAGDHQVAREFEQGSRPEFSDGYLHNSRTLGDDDLVSFSQISYGGLHLSEGLFVNYIDFSVFTEAVTFFFYVFKVVWVSLVL